MMSNLFDKESVFPNDYYVHDSVRTDFVNLSLHSSFPDLFISKDIRFALGHVYYKSLASFLSFILLIFFSTKNVIYPQTTLRKIKRQTLFAPGHVYYGQKVSPKAVDQENQDVKGPSVDFKKNYHEDLVYTSHFFRNNTFLFVKIES